MRGCLATTLFVNTCLLVAAVTVWTHRPRSHSAAVATVASASVLTTQVGVLAAWGVRRCCGKPIMVNPLANSSAAPAGRNTHP